MNVEGWATGLLGAVFVVAAGAVWVAGVRLSRYAGIVSRRTGVGQAFVGVLLLGGVTSLPEVAVTVSASLAGNAAMAVNNLLGGLAMQVVILAVADPFIGRLPITAVIAHPVVLLQGTFDVLLLVVIALGIAVGDVAVAGVGLWSTAVFVMFVMALWLVHRYQSRQTWVPDPHAARGGSRHRPDPEPPRHLPAGPSLRHALLGTVVVALIILAAGYVLSTTADVLADRTGLGDSFVGAVFLAISTSLPELSTVIAAARSGDYELAFGDIFGTNLFDAGLVFVVDLAYAGGPVLSEVGVFAQVAALLGVLVTTIFLAGLIERHDRSIARMGPDSILALTVYAAGIALLYTLR